MNLSTMRMLSSALLAGSFVAHATYAQRASAYDSPTPLQVKDQSFYLGRPVFHPERLSGIWESPDGHGGVIGLHLMLNTAAPNDIKSLSKARQSWINLQASIYQRTSDTFEPGNSNGFTDSLRGGSLRYDDGKLILHAPGFDLDLLYISGDRWSGRVHRAGFDSYVTLVRPGYKSGSKQAWFVGTWLSSDGPFHSCLHITQSAPGEFIAWSDALTTLGLARTVPNVEKPPYSLERYGELAQVRAMNGNAKVELHAFGGLCCSLHFTATPSKKADLMKADWPADINQISQKTEWKKMSGNTCIPSGFISPERK